MKTTPLLIWLLWVVYVGIQGFFLHINPSVYYKALFNMFIMSLVAYMSHKDFHNTLKYIIVTLYITTIASLMLIPAILMGLRQEEGSGVNWTALNAVYLIFFIFLLALLKKWRIIRVVLWLILPVIAVIMSASRKAFGGLVIAVFAYLFLKFRNGSMGAKIVVLLFGVVVMGGFYYVLETTMLGERFMNMGDSDIDYIANNATGTFWDIFDERGLMYYYGIEIFKKHPFGIGLGNFQNYFIISLAAHSEYVVQFCECGIVGLLLFVIFYSRVVKSYRRIYKYDEDLFNRQVILYLISGIVMVLFLSFSTWFYSLEAWACFMGLIIGYASSRTRQITYNSI